MMNIILFNSTTTIIIIIVKMYIFVYNIFISYVYQTVSIQNIDCGYYLRLSLNYILRQLIVECDGCITKKKNLSCKTKNSQIFLQKIQNNTKNYQKIQRNTKTIYKKKFYNSRIIRPSIEFHFK